MSLISSASPWINEEGGKKRTPTMRKTIKIRPYAETGGVSDISMGGQKSYQPQPLEYLGTEEEYKKAVAGNTEDSDSTSANNHNRINEILNKITSVDRIDNDGNKLANFQPLENPQIISKPKGDPYLPTMMNPAELLPANPLYPYNNSVLPGQTSQSENGAPVYRYASVNGDNNVGSNYKSSYEAPTMIGSRDGQKPYYASMGIGNSVGDEKVLQKINYMIHLLEQQHNEKTANMTEEFILYIFLGVFMIFTIDSFTRGGKYIR